MRLSHDNRAVIYDKAMHNCPTRLAEESLAGVIIVSILGHGHSPRCWDARSRHNRVLHRALCRGVRSAACASAWIQWGQPLGRRLGCPGGRAARQAAQRIQTGPRQRRLRAGALLLAPLNTLVLGHPLWSGGSLHISPKHLACTSSEKSTLEQDAEKQTSQMHDPAPGGVHSKR